MDLESVRQLVAGLDFDIAGIDATITLPNDNPVSGRAIWMRSLVEDLPVGKGYATRGPRRVMAIQRSEFAEVPRGTIISAPEKLGAAASNWQVDGIEQVTRAHFIVSVVAESI